MTNMMRVLGQIAGIGGIALGIFLLLFREVIRKKVFPMLTRDQAYRLLRMVLVLVWSIGVLGITAWSYINTRPAPNFDPGRFEITDLFVDNNRSDSTAVLDFRVVNRGNHPLSINRIRVTVVTAHDIPILPPSGGLPFSGKYDLDISDLKKPGDRTARVVSQALQAGEVDRFGLVLTARTMPQEIFRTWLLQVTLVTSEGEFTTREPVKVELPNQPRFEIGK